MRADRIEPEISNEESNQIGLIQTCKTWDRIGSIRSDPIVIGGDRKV